ncbi:MAG TPA: hypothetical protein VF331_15260 [Polyangiales bacterium]
MLIKRILLSTVACGLLACSAPTSRAAGSGPASATSSPAASTLSAPVTPATPVEPPSPAPAAPVPVAVVPAPVVPEGPPRKSVKGEGISIIETSDGRVVLKTTARWGEAIDTIYTDCSFYTAAVPVLKRQLSAARAKLLTRVCAHPAGKPKP